MKQKLYLSMPISGYEINERIKRANEMKEHLINVFQEQYEIITPFDVSPYDPDKSYGDCMKDCIKELITCDAVYFDDEWYSSNGCRVEAEVARSCGLKLLMY